MKEVSGFRPAVELIYGFPGTYVMSALRLTYGTNKHTPSAGTKMWANHAYCTYRNIL